MKRLLLFFSVSAFAASPWISQAPWQSLGQWVVGRPTQLTQYFVSPPEFRPVQDPRIIGRMIQILDGVATTFASTLKLPPFLRIMPIQSASNAFFSGVHPSLVLAYINEMPDGSKKHPIYTEAIWMHEYGHALLDANLTSLAPTFGAKSAEINQRLSVAFQRAKIDPIHDNLIQLAAYPIFGELNTLKRLRAAPSLIAAAQARFDQARAGYNAAKEKFKEVEKTVLSTEDSALSESMDQLSGPYHELAADFVAVIASENPQAERDVLLQPEGTAAQRNGGIARDFTVVRSVKSWHDTTTHHFFSPVRSWVWKYCLSGPRMSALRQNQGKALLLRKLFEGIGHEIETRYLQREFQLDIRVANERLIRTIDAVATKPDHSPLCHN